MQTVTITTTTDENGNTTTIKEVNEVVPDKPDYYPAWAIILALLLFWPAGIILLVINWCRYINR